MAGFHVLQGKLEPPINPIEGTLSFGFLLSTLLQKTMLLLSWDNETRISQKSILVLNLVVMA